MSKQKLLIFIVAYNAETTISQVLSRIPKSLADNFEVDVLIIDDASKDNTFDIGKQFSNASFLPFPVKVLKNPINQGYGGNQKLGYLYALKNNFDFVALVHGDGQYPPEYLPQLLLPFLDPEVDAVFGSRMMERWGALKGGMPLYKYIGNKILTSIQNYILKTQFSEFHSGYRIYRVKALEAIPFDLNSNQFHFDTEIIIQLLASKRRIKELPIPTYYGDEICYVNGLRYAQDVFISVLKYKIQGLGLLYQRNFDVSNAGNHHQYELKIHDVSPHTKALKDVAPNSRVLDLGCGPGYVGELLVKEKSCHVTSVDQYPDEAQVKSNTFIQHDLSMGPPHLEAYNFDYILLLDVIEHLPNPELFLEHLYAKLDYRTKPKIIVSTGNIGFIVVRLMLLMGLFNYGKRGILDLTHTRLFTFSTLKKLFDQSGFDLLEEEGVPAPIALAVGEGKVASVLGMANATLMRISKKMFSYQMYMIFEPRPSLDFLLNEAIDFSGNE
ncbi:glycosyltransferase [Polynucleobacter sp. MWH-Mekk-B1]|uniref:bifunctional glycosyltransferase/class I SAM-dependent methyltransferase n=1 Tax=Polynucleobacter finlandensis TaxID=1855894 RepID=UPI001C0B2153|nr:bifunctional glycosyltransferase/class I SAM-dependent methyltransferase [Polynucleobacter finlandensis]MBU3545448.1 glycosyltransferase [Polynucleobacter finlandensis]